MNLNLSGRKAILPAASKGLGRATAELFAKEGADVAICARSADDLESAREALSAHGGKVIADVVDIADPVAYGAWVASSAEQLGGCDDFICFSSVGGAQAAEDVWEKAFQLDLMGTWRGIQAAMPWLEKSDAASIIAIASIVAVEPAFGAQPFAAMKAAITHHAAALATKLGPQGIRVNTVSPGPIFIENGAWDMIQKNRPEVYEATQAKVALGRLGREEEVAWAIGFLASPNSSFITGTNIVVDGGMLNRIQF
jgi:3-oxoacyl-[acyl-carrier protein] reductase